jgi:hypothetical protein
MGDAADAEGKHKQFQARQEALIEELASIRKDVIRWVSTTFFPTHTQILLLLLARAQAGSSARCDSLCAF